MATWITNTPISNSLGSVFGGPAGPYNQINQGYCCSDAQQSCGNNHSRSCSRYKNNHYDLFKFSALPEGVCLVCPKINCKEVHELKDDKSIKTKENKTMYKSLREFIERHSDLIWTLILALLLDKYVFEGKFKAKLTSMIETVVNKASEKVDSLS